MFLKKVVKRKFLCYNFIGGFMKGNKFVNFIAYLAIAFIALALLLELIFSKVGLSSSVTVAMNTIAQVIAYAITAVFAFFFAKEKKNVWWMLSYIVAVILIIVMIVLR